MNRLASAVRVQYLVLAAALVLTGCGGGDSSSGGGSTGSGATTIPPVITAPQPVTGVTSQAVATFAAPWSMVFLPDGRMLVTERPPTPTTVRNPTEPGRLHLVTQAGAVSDPITGLPDNVGLLDIKLDPAFARNFIIYISFMERDPTAPRFGRGADQADIDPAGLAVMRGRLNLTSTGATLTGASVIWRQTPKVVSLPGSGEPGGRMAFSPDGVYLFITAGDRQEFAPVQDMGNTLGKIIRIYPDGQIPSDNPFFSQAGAKPEIWTLGHRNPYGLNFSPAGDLWENEMGPMGGDELNVIRRGLNYGWPNVSYGDNYDGSPITKPAAGDGFAMSQFFWTPVIAPSNMLFYKGDMFADWRGDIIISGLQSKGLVRVRLNGTTATEVQRISLNVRTRSVVEGPDGALWVLEDQPTGRLLKLSPTF